jgi:ubiquinone biosynthesis protein UbiJ
VHKKVMGSSTLLKNENDVVINSSEEEFENYITNREKMKLDRKKLENCMSEIANLRDYIKELTSFIQIKLGDKVCQ